MPIRTVIDENDDILVAIERIYVDSLPAKERKPIAWLRSLPIRTDYRLFIAEADSSVLGFAILYLPKNPNDAALLEYLAVAAGSRDRGVGSGLVEAAFRLAARPVLIEIKADDVNAARRQLFYERHGAKEIAGLRYILPLPGAPAMKLMVAGLWPPPAVIRQWVTTVYVEVYGQSSDDVRLAEMFPKEPRTT